MRSVPLWALAAAGALSACGGSGQTGPGQNAGLSILAGDGQSAPVGSALPQPLAVLVRDDGGSPRPGVTVTWSAIPGGGSITAASTTDQDGVAHASATLGTRSGPQSFLAQLSDSSAAVTFTATATPDVAVALVKAEGDGQVGSAGQALRSPFGAEAQDQYGNPVPGVTVGWAVGSGGGGLSGQSSVTDAGGRARVTLTLGPAAGSNTVSATAGGLAGSPLLFSATGVGSFQILGGGNNVPERYSSDLSIHGGYAYTGTWGFRSAAGNAVKVWNVQGTTPVLVDSIITQNIGTVSDVEVSSDGAVLLFSAEGGGNNGLYLYSLADPAHPTFIASYPVANGIHTATFGYIGGKRYAFAARDPATPALMIFAIDETSATPITLAATVPEPANYGVHDTFVRDGIAFVFVWNTGVILYDVGNGMLGGSPANPVEISRLITSANGVPGGAAVHNGWWFHNPVSGENRYLFIGQEGPGTIGQASSGDIHVVDVSDLAHPVEVAFYHRPGAGTHNFWMDEQKQILYAAYYNGGVVAIDVSGTLRGDISQREVARIAEGGPNNTYTWGVQLDHGVLYAIDMVSGLWELSGL